LNINKIVWHLRNPPLGWASYENVFSDEEVARIISHTDNIEVERGLVVEKGEQFEFDGRRSDISWLLPTPETQWLYKKLTDAILGVNSNNFNFNLTGIEPLQFSSYKADELGHYGKHKDILPRDAIGTNRKLSFTLQLSEPSTYEGGDIVMLDAANDGYEYTTRTKGSMIFFPSNQMHAVTPVTRGIRQSLVGWVVGPDFN